MGKRKICGKGMVWLYDFNHFISSVSLLLGNTVKCWGYSTEEIPVLLTVTILSFLVGQSLHIAEVWSEDSEFKRQQESLHLFKGMAFYSQYRKWKAVRPENKDL